MPDRESGGEAQMNTSTIRQAGAFADSLKNDLADEQRLISNAKGGHSSAFGELYLRHRVRVFRSAFRILRNRQDAEDAVQRSFQRALTNLCHFRGDSTFATWITRIAINEALMLLRKRRANMPLTETEADERKPISAVLLPDARPTPEQVLAENELRSTMADAVSRLRKNLRAVVLLREFQGLTSAETARQLGLTVSAVKARTFHARRHLRKHFERKYKVAHAGALIVSRN
jgi:RNA polymerase sigma-70 factor, ECF subfamily